MIWENGTETCKLSYVKRIASPGSMHDTGCLGLLHWDDPEGWDGEGVWRGFRMGNTCTPMADSSQRMAKLIQCCKVKQINKFFLIFLKIKEKKKKIEQCASHHYGLKSSIKKNEIKKYIGQLGLLQSC